MKGFQRIYLFESKEEDCDAYKKQENVRYIDSKQKAEKGIEEIKNLIKERKEEYQDQLDDGEEIAAKVFYQSLPPVALCINGLEEFTQIMKDCQEKDIEGFLQEAAEAGIFLLLVGHSGRMTVRDETSKYAKTVENGLVLGEQGVFPVKTSKELPQVLEDGLLFRKGSSVMIRIPRALPAATPGV